MTARVSVIIAVYNGERYLAQTLASLMAQQYDKLEIIVVDDGSTDNTASIARGFDGPVEYLHQENQGQSAAFNKGLAYTSGDIIGAVDADDLWSQDKLNLQLPPLLENSGPDMCVGMLRRFWVDEQAQSHYLEPERAHSFLAGLFRRELFDRVGPLDTTMRTHCDIDWFMRARDSGATIREHNDVVGFYRRHGDNMSTNTEDEVANSAMLALLKRSLQRRREGSDD